MSLMKQKHEARIITQRRLVVVTLSMLGALGTSCNRNPSPSVNSPLPNTAQAPSQTIDDRTDEQRPPFVDVPTRNDIPTASSTPLASGTAPPSTGAPVVGGGNGGGLGAFQDMSCPDYVAKYWKVGSQTNEEASTLLVTIRFQSTVTAVVGTKVTMTTKLMTGMPQYDSTDEISFDACTESQKSAVPSTASNCPLQDLGIENVMVNGVNYRAHKMQIGECTTSKGETFKSIVWRVAEVPMWGVVKREVSGTFVPSQLNGKLSPTTKSWVFP